jgi:hypothetical protein
LATKLPSPFGRVATSPSVPAGVGVAVGVAVGVGVGVAVGVVVGVGDGVGVAKIIVIETVAMLLRFVPSLARYVNVAGEEQDGVAR